MSEPLVQLAPRSAELPAQPPLDRWTWRNISRNWEIYLMVPLPVISTGSGLGAIAST